MSNDKNAPQWKVEKVWTHDETGVMVTVKKLDVGHRAKRSMAIGVEIGTGEEARPAPFLPGTRKGWHEVDFAPIVAELVETAQAYILEASEKDAVEAASRAAEAAQREAEKRKRHTENVEARRVANRAAASAAKGKRG